MSPTVQYVSLACVIFGGVVTFIVIAKMILGPQRRPAAPPGPSVAELKRLQADIAVLRAENGAVTSKCAALQRVIAGDETQRKDLQSKLAEMESTMVQRRTEAANLRVEVARAGDILLALVEASKDFAPQALRIARIAQDAAKIVEPEQPTQEETQP